MDFIILKNKMRYKQVVHIAFAALLSCDALRFSI